MGAQPVILTGTRDNRLKIGLELGADAVVNVRDDKDVVAAVNRGGKVCLAAFPQSIPSTMGFGANSNRKTFGLEAEFRRLG